VDATEFQQLTEEPVETVSCLGCSHVYPRPSGTTEPGCPVCGYLGWLASSVPVLRTPLSV
jgi:hypothetical protein